MDIVGTQTITNKKYEISVLYADRSCRSLCTTAQNTPKCGKLYIKTLLKYTFLNASTGVSWKYRRGLKTHAYSDLGLFWSALNLFKTKKNENIFLSSVPYLRKRITFWMVSRLLELYLLVSATCTRRWVWSIEGMIMTGENRSTRIESCPSATSSTDNLTWPLMRSNPGLHSDRTSNNHLSHGMVIWRRKLVLLFVSIRTAQWTLFSEKQSLNVV